MPGKRFQVFISSTFDDMQNARKAVWQRLVDYNYIVAGMETFPASSDEPFEYIKPIIDESDYFVLIIGARYGSTPDGGTKSYTEMEFDYAMEKNVPVLVFIIDDISAKDRVRTDRDEIKSTKLKEFVDRASRGRMVNHWKDESDLAFGVIQAVFFESNRKDRPGWTREVNVNVTELLVQNKLLSEKISNLEKTTSKAETMTYDDMCRELDASLRFSIRIDAKDEYEGCKFEVHNIVNLEKVFSDPSYESIKQSIVVIGSSTLGHKISEVSAIDLDVDTVLLLLRRLRVVEFDVDGDRDSLRRGPNWLLAHEAARSFKLGHRKDFKVADGE